MPKPVRWARPARRRPRFGVWRLARANFYDLILLLRESWVVLVGFAALVLAGTLYLTFSQQLAVAPAIYETLKLLTLQSGLPLPSDRLGQLLFFLIPLLGLALIFQSVLNFGRLLLDKGSRREAWQVALASTYRDHVIVCGLGRVSLRVVIQLLESGYEVVVIEREWGTEFVERALHLKVPVVLGDARERATLRQAGLNRACALVAGVNDDLLNIEIALTARAARADIRVILRVFNEELDHNLERILGPNTAYSASALAAPTYAAAAVSRDLAHVLPIGEELLAVAELEVAPGGGVCGATRALEERHHVRVLDCASIGGRPGLLGPGDRLTLLGSLAAIESVRDANRPDPSAPLPPQHPTRQFNTVIVCGLGKVGYRVVRQLHQLRQRPRIVVVRLGDGRGEFPQHISALDGVTTVIGDARDPQVLREAGIDRAYAVAALTGDDLLNLQIGLVVRRERPDVHVVLRVFSDTLADRLADMIGIHTVYSTSGLAAPTLAATAVLGDVGHAVFAAGRLLPVDHFTVRAGGPLTDQSVAALRASTGALVIGLRRDGETRLLPPLDARVAASDEVTLLAPIEALAHLRAELVAAPATALREAQVDAA